MTTFGQEKANEALVRDVQRWLKTRGHQLEVDGWAGPRTRAAIREAMRAYGLPAPEAEPLWPSPDEIALMDFYGPPGGSEQVYIKPPYPMVLAWDPDTKLSRIQCHRLVADSLREVLTEIYDVMGMDWILAHHLNEFAGCYTYRKMRGSDRWSTHAWGIAIDLASRQNGLWTSWPKSAEMPEEAIEIFEGHGWTSLGKVLGRDAMHFQATSWP